jgi:hypothetical protein
MGNCIKKYICFNCKCLDIEKGGFNDLSSRSAKENNTGLSLTDPTFLDWHFNAL